MENKKEVVTNIRQDADRVVDENGERYNSARMIYRFLCQTSLSRSSKQDILWFLRLPIPIISKVISDYIQEKGDAKYRVTTHKKFKEYVGPTEGVCDQIDMMIVLDILDDYLLVDGDMALYDKNVFHIPEGLILQITAYQKTHLSRNKKGRENIYKGGRSHHIDRGDLPKTTTKNI